jgi:hypothetical protein
VFEITWFRPAAVEETLAGIEDALKDAVGIGVRQPPLAGFTSPPASGTLSLEPNLDAQPGARHRLDVVSPVCGSNWTVTSAANRGGLPETKAARAHRVVENRVSVTA